MESPIELKEVFVELREKYEKACLLIEDESKTDPGTEPYRSKYAASKILTEMKSKLVKILDDMNVDSPDYATTKAMLGVVWLLLGTISLDTEELSTGEEQLMKCVECLSEDALRPEYIIAIITALNQLGLLWSQRDQAKKSQEYLERAENLYKNYIKEINLPAVDAYGIFNSISETSDTAPGLSLEKTHTLTLYYLAQIYRTLSDNKKSAVYCHTTLKRQLETKDFDPVDWALNAATLSQYLMDNVGFTEARHHLAAASFILDQYEAEVNQVNCDEEELDAKRERVAHRGADVARCWAKYGLMLLSNSKDRLMEQGESTSHSQEACEQSNENDGVWYKFSSLEVSSYEDQITDKYILTFEDARKVFLKTQEWLTSAKLYYTLDTHASDCVQIIQDHSQLFSYIAFFEEDDERRSRMHKRRVDLLEPVIQELNPQYYLFVCRQLWYELALTYSDILGIKLDRVQSSNSRPTPHALRKINHLATSSITNFQHFLDSLRDTRTKEFPDALNEDLERPALMAHFYIGRLYSKLVVPAKSIKQENVKKSIDAYKFVVDYCEKHDSGRQKMSAELGICQEMVKLLQLKLGKLPK